MIKNITSNKAAVIVTLMGIGLIVLISRYKTNQKRKVLENFEFTIGSPSDYSTSGEFQECYVTYEYTVSNYLYSNSIRDSNCNECDVDITPCADKRYWVAYQKDDPSNSLINLYLEIQNVTSPKPPATLDNFW